MAKISAAAIRNLNAMYKQEQEKLGKTTFVSKKDRAPIEVVEVAEESKDEYLEVPTDEEIMEAAPTETFALSPKEKKRKSRN